MTMEELVKELLQDASESDRKRLEVLAKDPHTIQTLEPIRARERSKAFRKKQETK